MHTYIYDIYVPSRVDPLKGETLNLWVLFRVTGWAQMTAVFSALYFGVDVQALMDR
jgi:hypothetical protein